MLQKSYEKKETGNLYIVPTPIGNMKDITLRAIEILQSVDIIYAEDTRTSRILLKEIKASVPVKPCHLYNENEIKSKMILELKDGKNLALISDRGTPLLSDPGYEVVVSAIESNINVISLPGASALLPALNMSGIEANHFLFYGFLNSKESSAKKELQKLKDLEFTIVFYESPHRFIKTLNNILNIFGDRKISVCREISKMYEEIFRGTVSEAINTYESIKGEIVIVVEKGTREIDYKEILGEIKVEVKNGKSSKDAIKSISKKYGVSKNLLYNMYEEEKK